VGFVINEIPPIVFPEFDSIYIEEGFGVGIPRFGLR
jgi:hypothetical protein